MESIISAFELQSNPKGTPALVEPSPNKMDLESCITSIPKFCCLGESEQVWWKQFLQQLEKTMTSAPHSDQWLFSKLKELSFTMLRVTTEGEQLPQRIAGRCTKDSESIPEVNSQEMIYLHTIEHLSLYDNQRVS